MCLLLYTATEDFTTVSDLILTFTPNLSSINIPVFIIHDNNPEEEQFFFGNLQLSNNPTGGVMFNPHVATVTIEGKCH